MCNWKDKDRITNVEHIELVTKIREYIANNNRTTVAEISESIDSLQSLSRENANFVVQRIVHTLDDIGVIDYIDHTCYHTQKINP